MESESSKSLNFIEQIVRQDVASGKHDGKVQTRFPPEPNGYLHIGHAKSICLNFGIAQDFQGKCNLRFDDTNPETEDVSYVNSIKKDIQWLGFRWDNEFYASDYFDQLYEFACHLIRKNKAYVDDQTQDQISEGRRSPTVAGVESPYRNRSVEENLDLFERMKSGEFDEGTHVLRARIDMSSPNMHMRDPVLYRIKKATHHRTGNAWFIYPTYDFAHGQSDSIEGITHSLCTLEFEVHRPLYEWFINELEIFPSRQIEFARLNLSYTVMSKRRLLLLVKEKIVDGWDDPRMPTLSAMRRRGYPPEAIVKFCDQIGVAKRDNLIDLSMLEFYVRENLNQHASRVMSVMDPVKLTITNYPDEEEFLEAVNNPEKPEEGKRTIPFSRNLLIEKEDFMEDPPSKFFRLGPDRMVRLKYAYIVRCTGFTKDESGEIREIFCEYLPESKSGSDTSGVKTKGTLHWVSASHSLPAEVRSYERLFTVEEPSADKDKDFLEHIDRESKRINRNARVEPSLKNAKPLENFQFERKGYYCVDTDSREGNLIFNQTVTLKDSWSREKSKQS